VTEAKVSVFADPWTWVEIVYYGVAFGAAYMAGQWTADVVIEWRR
jgi:hypothetical protein